MRTAKGAEARRNDRTVEIALGHIDRDDDEPLLGRPLLDAGQILHDRCDSGRHLLWRLTSRRSHERIAPYRHLADTMRSDIAAIDDARQPHAGKDTAVASH